MTCNREFTSGTVVMEGSGLLEGLSTWLYVIMKSTIVCRFHRGTGVMEGRGRLEHLAALSVTVLLVYSTTTVLLVDS